MKTRLVATGVEQADGSEADVGEWQQVPCLQPLSGSERARSHFSLVLGIHTAYGEVADLNPKRGIEGGIAAWSPTDFHSKNTARRRADTIVRTEN